MANHETLFLSLEDVVNAGGTDMGAAIEDVQRGFELREAGRVVEPHKLTLSSSESETNGFNVLPSIVDLGENEVFGCKLLGANPENIAKGLPRALGLIALFDGESKEPLAVMDTQVISAMRTGAVSGLAAKQLAPSETESVGLIGAGVNMRTQLLGIKHALPALKQAQVSSTNGSKYSFAEQMAERTNIRITAHTDPQEVIQSNQFNILCTTKPTKPLIKRDWLAKSGLTLFNISGVATPPEALQDMDRLITDSWGSCLSRNTQSLPKAVQQGFVSDSDIEELGKILKNDTGRQNSQENIFFCPVGLAFEDVIVGWRVYNTAIQKKIGQKVTLWSNPKWI